MKALLRKIRQILKDRRTRRFLTRFVSGIAAVVVFVTTYALVLPAITMESQAACGIEAHQHDDSCYSEKLICGQEESEGHHHTDDCYTVTRELECQIQEHQHSSENGCFDEEGNLVCKLEEHTHADSCYKEHRELTCGLEETEGHHHTDSCYEKVLTCGKEVHTHSTACYKADLQIESAAVASTGMTSAAAVPDLSDEDYYSEDDSLASKSLDEAENTDGDDKITSEDSSEDETEADIEEENTDRGEIKDGSDDVDKDDKKDKDNSKGEEEAASSFSTGFAADENAENGDAYIPEKDALNFNTVLNGRTGIYFHHVAEDEEIVDSSSITDWDKADENTKLNPEDLIRVYLSYTLPKDTINATNDISRYRLPDALHLTDEQIEAINACENGISAQYMDYDNLEITDPDRHAAYLGIESVEGRRVPGEEMKEDSQEYISAVVRAEKIYDEETGEYEGTDLIFTFSPYAIEKNAHAYDKKGQPTKAGEEVTGWLTLDFNMGQIDWAEGNTSEIVFAEEDQENDISEISAILRQGDPADVEADESAANGTTEAAAEYATEEASEAATAAEIAAENSTEEAAAAATASETAAESSSEKTDAKNDSDNEKDNNEESTAASYPAAVFEDSITVNSGRLDTDLADTALPKKTKMTVHVEADEGTFPEGTRMVLSAVEDLDAVAEAVGSAVDEKKTRGFQAVDITFYDSDPAYEGAKEIQPLKPIRVSITSDEIKKAAGDSSTAPVVVHVKENTSDDSVENNNSKAGASEGSRIGADIGTQNDENDSLTFEADSFSVYAVVYTVELKTNVLTANGQTYEVTVTCGEDAEIPETAELRVKEIRSEDKEYKTLRRNIEDGLSDSDINTPVNPVLFDISIWDGENEIEPKEGSKVKVEVKLVRSALKGLFSDENTPLLINNAPVQVENGYVEKSLQVIHQTRDGETEVMDTFDNITAEEAMASFTTDSFSNWLVFLDESTQEITVGPGDSITLRPYNEWSWDEPSEQGDDWTNPGTDSAVTDAATVTPHTVTDSNLNHTYTFYDLDIKSNAAGKEFDVKTVTGRTIHIKVAESSPEQPTPPTVSTVTNADEGITFNLYDYDKSGNLDESNNKAEFWSSKTYNEQDNNRYEKNTVNEGHALKFLGWGYSGKYNSGWRGSWASGGILDYTGTTVSPGIVKSDLTEYTLDDGSKILVPELADFDEDLGYLFDTDATWTNTGDKVQAYANADGLFQKSTTGYYYYNSNSNYAYFNGEEFEVYEHTYQQHTQKNDGGNGKPIGFFPFHEYEPDKDTDGTYGEGKQWMNHNKYLNHHFGMDMAVDFEIPADGLDELGNPITFEFSGDDDLWVFIDGKLVLDVGGIHQPVTASINFSDDVVKVTGQEDTTIQDMFNQSESPKTWTKGEGVPHKMQVFYLERGGCDSNLSIRFNMPTTLGKGELRVIKNDSKTPTTTLANATFGLYSDPRCENLLTGKEKTSGPDGLLDFGELAFKDANTTYYLKEISAPAGYLIDTGVYQVKPYILNGKVQRDSTGNIVLQIIDPEGNPLAQTNPSELALSRIEFPNEKASTIDIPAEKKWADGVITEDAQITLTIKRYKLVHQTKGLTIEQNLINKPDDHAFAAQYSITYTATDGEEKTILVNYSDFAAGRYTITDIAPGEYTVVQNIRSGVPENYTRTDDPDSHQVTVQLAEDGTATAQFNTTYVQKKGTLNLKSVVNNIPSGVSYQNVRYVILDSNGKKVDSATYDEVKDGKNFSLPVGTYSIKAVNMPKDPDGCDVTRTVTRNGTIVEGSTIDVGSVTITDGGTTSVQFNSSYSDAKLVNSYFKVMDYHDGRTFLSIDLTDNSKTNNQELKEGDKITFLVCTKKDTVYSQSEAWSGSDNVSFVQYGEYGGYYQYRVTVTVQSNNEAVFKVNANKYAPGYPDNGIVKTPVEVVSIDAASRSLSRSLALRAASRPSLGSAAGNTEEIHETNPADAHTETDPDTHKETTVPANLPDAPEFKKYVKDVDPETGSDWQRTIVLNNDNTPDAWKDTLEGLEAEDVDGNPYYYYVAAVDETGLEKVTTVSFGNNGDELLLIGKDNLGDNTLNVTNTVKRQGALALTKIVTLNGVDNTTDMTNGDYSFTIQGVAGTATADINHNVTIRFENGRAIRYTVDGTGTACKGTDNSWTVVLQNLTAGDYVITESPMSNTNMVLTSVTGGKGDGNKDEKKVTVTVHPGDEEPENDDAKATFTNDRTEKVTITVTKVWEPQPLDSENPSITVKLHRYAKKTKGTINITLKDTMPDNPDHVSAPIEGAVFTLYEADSPDDGPWTATSTTVTTDVNGNASVSNLAPGKSYKLVQTYTPQRYRYDTENPPESAVLTVRDNSLAHQEVSTTGLTNEALVTSATVTLTLTESSEGSGSTDNIIDGAKFKLYKDGALYSQEEYITGAVESGKIIVSGLPAGEYYFVQTGTTAPYRMPADPKTAGFTVLDEPWTDQTGLTQSMTNDLKGKGTVTVKLHKDSETGDPIEGAEFQLKQGDMLKASGTTGQDGTVTFTNVYEGSYTVHQIDAGDAESEGYEPDTNAKTVTIEANSVTDQEPDPIDFVNESTRGNVTIRLWVNQGKNEYNWAKMSDVVENATFEYLYLKAGETYSFTSTFDSRLYPTAIWTYWDTGDLNTFIDEGYSAGEQINKYRHSIVENNIAVLNGNDYNGGTYSFTFPIPADAEDGTVYNLAMISNWGYNSINSFSMSQPKPVAINAAAPMSKTSTSAGKKNIRSLSAGKAPIALRNAPAVTEAHPNVPSLTDYFHDEGFCEETPITAVINKDTNNGSWTYEFPAQDKYDQNGEPYYYYVEETDSTPDEYTIQSYQGDPVSGADTGNITITNTRPQYGSLKLTKAVTVNGQAPSNSREWAMVTGDYTFTVKNGEQETVKTITLHVDSTGVSLVSPTADADVTLADGVVTIAKLSKGNYTVEETTPTNGTTLSGVTVSDSGSVTNKVATVNVKDKNQQTTIPLVTFTNNINTRDLSLTKNVAGEGADESKGFAFTIQLTAPDGQTLADSYTFKKNGAAAEGITYTKDANNAAKATVSGITLKHNDVFTIEDLPEGTSYEISEDDYSSEGYSSNIVEVSEGVISGEDKSVTVTNTLSAGNLTVEKAIEGNATDADKDFNFSVTFNKAGLNRKVGSYRKGTSENIEQATPVDITFNDGTATVTFTLKGGQKAEFTNLPNGTTFIVNETSKDADGYETTVTSTGGTANNDKTVTGSISATTAVTASYVNKKSTTTAEAAKEWKSGAQTIDWPADVSKVEFTLYAKIGDAEPVAINDASVSSYFTGIQAVKEINAQTTGKKADWTDLPTRILIPEVAADPANGIEAKPAEWKDVTYSVKETKIVLVDNTEEAAAVDAVDNVITNEVEKVQIHATKKWQNKNGIELDGTEGRQIPAGAQVTFTLVKDGTADSSHTVVLNGVDETRDPASGNDVTPANTDYEGAGWTAYFTNLPKYNADGTLISYSVKETGKWTGYQVDGSDTVGDGGIITNKESSIDIHILKVDKQNNNPLTGATFVLRRYGEEYHEVLETWNAQEVSAERGKEGTLTFDKLQVGWYELEETIPPEGYIKTTSNPRFSITCDQNGNLVVTYENTDMVPYNPENKTFTVKNEPGAELPESGGPGTGMFTILGTVLLAIAGILLIRRRRTI